MCIELFIEHSATSDSSDSRAQLNYRVRYVLQMYQSVPVDVFEEKLREAHSPYDIIRIYYPKHLKDSEIDRIMQEGIMSARIPYGHSVRPSYEDVVTNKQSSWDTLKEGSNHLPQSDQPADFHIPYTYTKFRSKRRHRRHHRRKETQFSSSHVTNQTPGHVYRKLPFQSRLNKHINSSGGQRVVVPVKRRRSRSHRTDNNSTQGEINVPNDHWINHI